MQGDEAVSLSPGYQQAIRQAVNGAASSSQRAAQPSQPLKQLAPVSRAPSRQRDLVAPNGEEADVAAPLSEALLSQHSAALDQDRVEGSRAQGISLVDKSVLVKLQEDIKSLQLPAAIDSGGGLFDEDEAAEGFVDSLENFSSPDERSRHSSKRTSPVNKPHV
jgi:hypothetical protein